MKLLNCPCCGSRRTMVMATVGRWACCSECGLSTKSFLTEQEAADAWNQRSVKLEWGSELPTESGWYWWLEKGDPYTVAEPVKVVNYLEVDDYHLCVIFPGIGKTRIENMGGKWCRIPEPRRAE